VTTDDPEVDALEAILVDIRDERYAYGQPEALIHYVMDLEALIRWFALLYTFKQYDASGAESEVVNDPIWTCYDERGTYLPEADRLQRTWNIVIHGGDPGGGDA
jgi:hypothetical protein